ncbi:proline-rich receptor-like protein kinase PERK2 [Penaeus monodon]|uniref:proline-rich receptor-like protein kinase PERK2 n=1 Tax=Penaeus monodon TaxID=6687 RepID=UPI0018A6F877|nr:proline-rich receptor-like protein kinase PERK2 [Penaeus monodon]
MIEVKWKTSCGFPQLTSRRTTDQELIQSTIACSILFLQLGINMECALGSVYPPPSGLKAGESTVFFPDNREIFCGSRCETAVIELPLTPPPSPQLPSPPPRLPFVTSPAPPCSPVPPPTPTTAPSPAPLHCRVSSAAHDIIPMRSVPPPEVLVAILTLSPAAPPSSTPSAALPPSLASGEVFPSRRTPSELPATSSSRRRCMTPADVAAVVNLAAMLVLFVVIVIFLKKMWNNA